MIPHESFHLYVLIFSDAEHLFVYFLAILYPLWSNVYIDLQCIFLIGLLLEHEIVSLISLSNILIFVYRKARVILHCVYVPQLSYPFIC